MVDVRVRLRSSVGILDEALDLTADLCTALFLQNFGYLEASGMPCRAVWWQLTGSHLTQGQLSN